jgi:hypothetical protein
MSVQSLPNPGFTLDALSSEAPDVLVRQLNLTTRHNDAPPVMLRLAFRTPDAAEDATAAAPGAVAPTAPASTAVASAAIVTAPPASPSKPTGAVVTASPTTPPPSAPIVAKPPAVTSPPPAPARPITAATAVAATPAKSNGTTVPPAAVAPATPAKTGDAAGLPSTPAPPEGSTLALVWKSTVDRLPDAPPPARDYDVIESGAVNNYAGRFVRVLTSGGKKVEGHIIGLGPDGTTLALRVNQPGGTAELQVQRSVIVEIRLPHQKAAAAGG